MEICATDQGPGGVAEQQDRTETIRMYAIPKRVNDRWMFIYERMMLRLSAAGLIRA